MSESAHELQIAPAVTVDGLDQLFDLTANSAQGHDQSALLKIAQGDEHGDQAVLAAPLNLDHWTLQTAADRLNVSVATIRRRLAKRQLRGYKVQGENGPEWRVIPPAQNDNAAHGYPVQSVEHPEHPVISVLLARLSDVESQLTHTHKDLQAANWRNGYLEAQLEAERQQVKLLTDSQHKNGWWSHFKKWCAGQ